MQNRLREVVVLLTVIVVVASFSIAPNACSWDYIIWQKSRKSDTPLFRFVVKEDLSGYIDKTGKVVISPRFVSFGNHGGDFFEGLAVVTIGASC